MSNITIPNLQVNSTSDSGQKTKLSTKKPKQTAASDFFPRLACQINLYNNQLILSQYGQEFAFPINQPSGKGLYKLFLLMDGTRSLHELQQLCSPEEPTAITKLLCSLDDQGLVDNAAAVTIHSGQETLLELEALSQKLLNQKLFGHSVKDIALWQLLQLANPEISDNVISGFVLEHYHLFSHISSFQSPTLGFQGSTKVRYLLNEFYAQTYGYEQIMVKALHNIDITPEELASTLPLPETMSMYNGLTFWANFEPLFFFSILGLLLDSILNCFKCYLTTISRDELGSCFIEAIGELVSTQQQHKQINLGRSIFQEIPHIDPETVQRFKGQIHLFVEMYSNFYRAIGHYYLETPNLLRRLLIN
ncbi:hypothetical protein [Leptothoe spongobia]|uniref:Uncharacterized protein n=1 Tax=Leptothoe spongobia TAU-MAC 1115 TaxID=1967444 RepID=A0A947DEI3_9CYAN|nr:hypothetical protein [Leptothoe spongobia]MBT9314436.1 hypothetical protein [Leptothoe spongobia TAU-MAC 1115]